MGGRPPIAAAPVSLLDGPITAERVFRVGLWDSMSDRSRVRKIRKMAEEYGHDPRLRWFVVNEVLKPSGVQPRDFRGQLQALYSYVQNNIYYTNESGEQIQAPWWTLKHKTGDCDDMALLLAAMLTSLAFPFRITLAGTQRSTGRFLRWVEGEPAPRGVEFSHIYLMAGNEPFKATSWIAMEPTLRGVPLGYDVAVSGLPGGMRAQDMGSRPQMAGYGQPYGYGQPHGYAMAPISYGRPSSERVAEIEALRTLPPLEAFREVGLTGLLTEWVDWNRTSIAVLEGVITTILLGTVLSAYRKGKR